VPVLGAQIWRAQGIFQELLVRFIVNSALVTFVHKITGDGRP
jgi:hypothetical protein